MIETPSIVQTEEQLVALIHLNIPRSEMMTAIGPTVQEILSTLAAQGIEPRGHWFAHHHRMSPGVFDFDVCIPVDEPVMASGRVVPGKWPAETVARTVYHGHYNGLHEGWGEFQDWIEPWLVANGRLQRADLYERYLVSTADTADPAEWRTELNRPLVA